MEGSGSWPSLEKVGFQYHSLRQPPKMVAFSAAAGPPIRACVAMLWRQALDLPPASGPPWFSDRSAFSDALYFADMVQSLRRPSLPAFCEKPISNLTRCRFECTHDSLPVAASTSKAHFLAINLNVADLDQALGV